MLTKNRISKIAQEALRWIKLAGKYSRRSEYVNLDNATKPVFVVGCQRSGTTMLVNTLGRSPEISTYHEGDKRAFDDEYRLISDDFVKRLIYESHKPIVIFKPINDSQHTDRLLKLNANAKAIWIFRVYQDVINSAVKLWGEKQKGIIYGISRGYYKRPGHLAIGERIAPETHDLIKHLCRNDLSSQDGAALIWYLRNVIYFDLNLQNNNRVLLYKYEDLVTKPQEHFRRVFDFIGCDFSPEYVEDIHARSIRKNDLPLIDPEIKFLCDSLGDRLEREYGLNIAEHV
jgi:hypothetical protein